MGPIQSCPVSTECPPKILKYAVSGTITNTDKLVLSYIDFGGISPDSFNATLIGNVADMLGCETREHFYAEGIFGNVEIKNSLFVNSTSGLFIINNLGQLVLNRSLDPTHTYNYTLFLTG
jgi:hypothetical protein